MAGRRTIKWTKEALEAKRRVFKYWNHHNKSPRYSKKLQKLIKAKLDKLIYHPNIGKVVKSDIGARVILVNNYHLIYIVKREAIYVLTFQDARIDPSKSRFKTH